MVSPSGSAGVSTAGSPRPTHRWWARHRRGRLRVATRGEYQVTGKHENSRRFHLSGALVPGHPRLFDMGAVHVDVAHGGGDPYCSAGAPRLETRWSRAESANRHRPDRTGTQGLSLVERPPGGFSRTPIWSPARLGSCTIPRHGPNRRRGRGPCRRSPCRCASLAARHRRDPVTPGRRPHRTARGRNGLMAPRKAQDASSPAAPSIRRSPCPGTRLGRRTSGP